MAGALLDLLIHVNNKWLIFALKPLLVEQVLVLIENIHLIPFLLLVGIWVNAHAFLV